MTVTTTPTLDTARQLWVDDVKKIGMPEARTAQRAAIVDYEAALAAKRETDAVVRLAAEVLSDALIDARFQIDISHFKDEGAKTYLTVGVPEPKAMTAPKREEYVAAQAKKVAAVVDATDRHRKAVDKAEAARDRVAVAALRVSACKYDLQAAGTMLDTLVTMTNVFNAPTTNGRTA